MAHIEVPLPLEAALRVRIALLEAELARTQDALMQQQSRRAIGEILHSLYPGLPPAQTPYQLDLATSRLCYEAADEAVPQPGALTSHDPSV